MNTDFQFDPSGTTASRVPPPRGNNAALWVIVLLLILQLGFSVFTYRKHEQGLFWSTEQSSGDAIRYRLNVEEDEKEARENKRARQRIEHHENLLRRLKTGEITP